jgi:predicted  nucleic acid-binding Zn-ribbon protein
MNESEEKVIVSRARLDQLESELANFKSGVKYSELRRKLHDLGKEKDSLTRQVFESMKAYNETSKKLYLLEGIMKANNVNAMNVAKESAEDKSTIIRLKNRIVELESTQEDMIRWIKKNRWKPWKKFSYNL